MLRPADATSHKGMDTNGGGTITHQQHNAFLYSEKYNGKALLFNAVSNERALKIVACGIDVKAKSLCERK